MLESLRDSEGYGVLQQVWAEKIQRQGNIVVRFDPDHAKRDYETGILEGMIRTEKELVTMIQQTQEAIQKKEKEGL